MGFAQKVVSRCDLDVGVAHWIELLLKAVLSLRGQSLRALSDPRHGHDLRFHLHRWVHEIAHDPEHDARDPQQQTTPPNHGHPRFD